MKKVPPFIQNSQDNTHCVNAVFRMVYKYYFNEDFTWEEIDELTKAIPGKSTWTLVGEMEFAKRGLKIINIELTDYEKLYREKEKYFKNLDEKVADYHLQKSNILSVIKYIPEYLKYVKHETRRPTVQEIINLLKKGSLVGAEINAQVLNNRPGFSLHFVLLYGFDGKNILLHDPGLPPIKSRKVSLEEFDHCFNFAGANGGITVFEKNVPKLRF